MKYCTQCGVKVTSDMNTCPLCKHRLSGEETSAKRSYPGFAQLQSRYAKISKLISGFAVTLILLLTYINIATYSGTLWFIVIDAYILYAWLLGLLTFKKNVHLGLKLIAHAIVIPLLLLLIDTFGMTTGTFQPLSWALAYTMPLIISAFIITISVLFLVIKSLRKEFFFYQMVLFVISFIPFGLVLGGLADPILPSILVSGFATLTMIGMAFLLRRVLGLELKKKLHTK